MVLEPVTPKQHLQSCTSKPCQLQELRDGAVCGEGSKTNCAVQGKMPNPPAEILVSKRHQLRSALREGKEEVGPQDNDFFGDLPLDSWVSLKVRVKLPTLDLHSYKLSAQNKF